MAEEQTTTQLLPQSEPTNLPALHPNKPPLHQHPKPTDAATSSLSAHSNLECEPSESAASRATKRPSSAEPDALRAKPRRRRRPPDAARARNSAPINVRDMAITDIISGMNRRFGGKPMPSTVQRAAERRKRRIALANGLPDPTEEPDTTVVAERADAPPVEPEETTQQPAEEEDVDTNVVAPQVTLDENGNIVIDQASLVVSAGTTMNAEAGNGDVTMIENHAYSNHITSATYSKRESPLKWEAAETEMFYEALRKFGTDFSLMQRSFPRRNRKQLKLKFKREERENGQRIDLALSGRLVPLPARKPPPPATEQTTPACDANRVEEQAGGQGEQPGTNTENNADEAGEQGGSGQDGTAQEEEASVGNAGGKLAAAVKAGADTGDGVYGDDEQANEAETTEHESHIAASANGLGVSMDVDNGAGGDDDAVEGMNGSGQAVVNADEEDRGQISSGNGVADARQDVRAGEQSELMQSDGVLKHLDREANGNTEADATDEQNKETETNSGAGKQDVQENGDSGKQGVEKQVDVQEGELEPSENGTKAA